MNEIIYIKDFITQPNTLFNLLEETVNWDERMSARKTASFGKAYNYSQINYPFKPFTKELLQIISLIDTELGFESNNCLVNYYLDGKSKMGFHSDQTDILVPNTGIAIVSLGEERILRFRNIEDKNITKDFNLESGSLIYMTAEIQDIWKHAIPK